MVKLSNDERQILRESLYDFNKKMWDLITYSRDSTELLYDPEFLTTNEGLQLKAIGLVSGLKATIIKASISHPFFERACELGLYHIHLLKFGQPRSALRWHLNNARCELLGEMRRDWSNVRINFEYLHPKI